LGNSKSKDQRSKSKDWNPKPEVILRNPKRIFSNHYLLRLTNFYETLSEKFADCPGLILLATTAFAVQQNDTIAQAIDTVMLHADSATSACFGYA
jgi:hypothetical protein